MDNKSIIYKPIPFLILTFCITWACAFFMAYQTWLDNSTLIGTAILIAVDFLESASPFLAAIILLRKSLLRKQTLLKFVFGDKPALLPCTVVVILFLYQFFTFYFFRVQAGNSIGFISFLGVWIGQILLGGGMEEGGWRGYLQPSFEKKIHPILGVLCVSLVWACWHLPYFFLPNTFQSGSNFLFYIITTTATAFTLTAIYKMSGSVLLCTLFHGWQNAIVMSLTVDMEHPGFLIMFGIQTAASIILCIKPIGTHRRQSS